MRREKPTKSERIELANSQVIKKMVEERYKY